MLDEQTTYAKTPKGLVEMETRACRMSPRLRSLLIIVDGNISTSSLIERAAALGQSKEALATLVTEGFIACRKNLNPRSNSIVTAPIPVLVTPATLKTENTPKVIAAPVIKRESVQQIQNAPRQAAVPIRQTLTPSIPETSATTSDNEAFDEAFDEASWFGDAPPKQRKTVSTARRSLAIARLYLIDSMERMYGNSSIAIREALRYATTKDAILLQLDHCVDLVAEGSDAKRAGEFRQRVIDLLPE